jgi:hypothetical protein
MNQQNGFSINDNSFANKIKWINCYWAWKWYNRRERERGDKERERDRERQTDRHTVWHKNRKKEDRQTLMIIIPMTPAIAPAKNGWPFQNLFRSPVRNKSEFQNLLRSLFWFWFWRRKAFNAAW